MSEVIPIMMCDKCKRIQPIEELTRTFHISPFFVQPIEELTRTFHISPFFVCRNREDCARSQHCHLCDHDFIHRGAS